MANSRIGSVLPAWKKDSAALLLSCQGKVMTTTANTHRLKSFSAEEQAIPKYKENIQLNSSEPQEETRTECSKLIRMFGRTI